MRGVRLRDKELPRRSRLYQLPRECALPVWLYNQLCWCNDELSNYYLISPESSCQFLIRGDGGTLRLTFLPKECPPNVVELSGMAFRQANWMRYRNGVSPGINPCILYGQAFSHPLPAIHLHLHVGAETKAVATFSKLMSYL